jgi:16S rRNA processing protein RimM
LSNASTDCCIAVDEGKIAIGDVRTSFGVRGELKVRSYSGETGHFLKLETVVLQRGTVEETFEVERVRKASAVLIMKLKGIESPEEGKKYRQAVIWVDRKFASERSKDEFYHADLVGCTVFFENRPIGEVSAIFDGGSGDLMEVVLDEKTRRLVPFHREFIGEVDIEGKKIELLVDWILE